MNDNYRRKDFFTPRSMKEATGIDDMPPELRCMTKFKRQKRKSIAPHLLAALILIVYAVVARWGH
jgi:hypothetical protein